jgi:hypothetical protein
MPTQEIPRAQWRPFFDEFSLRHEGWVVNVEIMGSDIGNQEQARKPLMGVMADVKDPIPRIEISVGNLLDGHVVHIIEAPERVWFKLPEISGDEAVEIQGEDGHKTLVTFVLIRRTDRQLPES